MSSYGQSTDLFRAEYITMPQGQSEVDIKRYRLLLNIPIQTAFDQYFVLGGEYNYIDFRSDTPFPFDNEEIENLHVIDLNLGYLFKWNENWRFVGIFSPRLASNFVGGLNTRDLKLNVTATFWKEESDVPKPFRIVLGLTYNSASGLPVPLPLISYFRRFHPKWSFAIGIPRSSLKYYPAEKHTIQTALFLDGYFVNSQNDLILSDGGIGDAISQRALVSAIGYQYNFNKNFSFYTIVGHTVFRTGSLRDRSKKEVFVTNSIGSLYIRGGFKFAIF